MAVHRTRGGDWGFINLSVYTFAQFVLIVSIVSLVSRSRVKLVAPASTPVDLGSSRRTSSNNSVVSVNRFRRAVDRPVAKVRRLGRSLNKRNMIVLSSFRLFAPPDLGTPSAIAAIDGSASPSCCQAVVVGWMEFGTVEEPEACSNCPPRTKP